MPNAELLELYARGLGVIDEARVEFGPGLNVITGETGAGKTLLLGALTLCLGADAASARHAFGDDVQVAAVLRDRSGEEVVFGRESGANRRVRSTLNGVATSVEALRMAGESLVTIHGQHDSLTLRNRSDILRLIDDFGGVDTSDLERARRRIVEITRLREVFGGDERTRERELDLLNFQLEELEAANLTSVTELDEALDQLRVWTSVHDGRAAVVAAIESFDGDGEDSLLAAFARNVATLASVAGLDDAVATLGASLASARDVVHDLRAFVDREDVDPETMARLEARVELLQRLARKYGGTLATVVATRESLEIERERLTNAEAELIALDQELRDLSTSEANLAATARRDREEAAKALSATLGAQLSRVALANASVRLSVDGPDGSDVQLLFTPNPGRPEGPVQSLASGGELSRLLLAVALVSASDGVVTVFDEVDAGIGGQVAEQIGDCLAQVARDRQVLAVTHLASVAARADHQFVIEKVVGAQSTTTTVREVTGPDRVSEIARMLAGDHLSEEARALAERMLGTTS